MPIKKEIYVICILKDNPVSVASYLQSSKKYENGLFKETSKITVEQGRKILRDNTKQRRNKDGLTWESWDGF